jgi:hypothetical protein
MICKKHFPISDQKLLQNFTGKSLRKQAACRSRHNWENIFKASVRQVGYECMNFIHLAQESVEGRAHEFKVMKCGLL